MPEKITIDQWGQIRGESENYRCAPPGPIEVDSPAEGDGAVYRRYFDETPCAFQRDTLVTSGGRMTIRTEVGYDDYANRESATYYPINAADISVNRQEILYSAGTQTLIGSAGSNYSSTLASAGLLYGSENAKYVSSSYTLSGGSATITSGGSITYNFTSAGTYSINALMTAPLAKPVLVPIQITIN